MLGRRRVAGPEHSNETRHGRRLAYARHRPEETLLYRAVAEHLETFLAHTREQYERPLPRYVERELRGYLRCGILAHGFSRAECRGCHATIVVA